MEETPPPLLDVNRWDQGRSRMTSTPLRGEARDVTFGGTPGQGDDDRSETGRTVARALLHRGCSYKKGGVCRIHGGGAKLKFKPSWVTTRGANGEEVRTYQKKSYYVCDLGQQGGGRLRQQGISFAGISPGRRVTRTPDTDKQGGDDSNHCKGGKHVNCGRMAMCKKGAGIE